jgi:hypothetical protein
VLPQSSSGSWQEETCGGELSTGTWGMRTIRGW